MQTRNQLSVVAILMVLGLLACGGPKPGIASTCESLEEIAEFEFPLLAPGLRADTAETDQHRQKIADMYRKQAAAADDAVEVAPDEIVYHMELFAEFLDDGAHIYDELLDGSTFTEIYEDQDLPQRRFERRADAVQRVNAWSHEHCGFGPTDPDGLHEENEPNLGAYKNEGALEDLPPSHGGPTKETQGALSETTFNGVLANCNGEGKTGLDSEIDYTVTTLNEERFLSIVKNCWLPFGEPNEHKFLEDAERLFDEAQQLCKSCRETGDCDPTLTADVKRRLEEIIAEDPNEARGHGGSYLHFAATYAPATICYDVQA